MKKVLGQHHWEENYPLFAAKNMMSAFLGVYGSLSIVYPVIKASQTMANQATKHKFDGYSDYFSKTMRGYGSGSLYDGFGLFSLNCAMKTGLHLGLFDSL